MVRVDGLDPTLQLMLELEEALLLEELGVPEARAAARVIEAVRRVYASRMHPYSPDMPGRERSIAAVLDDAARALRRVASVRANWPAESDYLDADAPYTVAEQMAAAIEYFLTLDLTPDAFAKHVEIRRAILGVAGTALLPKATPKVMREWERIFKERSASADGESIVTALAKAAGRPRPSSLFQARSKKAKRRAADD